jgi:UDP-glucose:glycoprotein glucosyltransferase
MKLAQDFPRYSSAIAQIDPTPELLAQFEEDLENFAVPAGLNVIWINGLHMSPRHIDAFSLLSHLRHERQFINAFGELGLSPREAVDLISEPSITRAHFSEDSPMRYDYRDEKEGGGVIIWLNNLEKDSRYKDWPSGLSALMQPSAGVHLPNVRRDVHNVILAVDLAEPGELELVVEQIVQFIKMRIPVQFGIVPTLRSPASIEQAKIVYHVYQTYGLSAAMAYLEKVRGNPPMAIHVRNCFVADFIEFSPMPQKVPYLQTKRVSRKPSKTASLMRGRRFSISRKSRPPTASSRPSQRQKHG